MTIWALNPPFLPKYSRPQRSPAVTKSGTIYFPLWMAYAVGVLEEAGHEVTFTDAPARGLDREAVLEQARNHPADLVILDTSTPSIANDLEVASEIRRIMPKALIVLVGTHVTACAEETLRNGPAVDAIARREYEYTLRELAEATAAAGPGRPSTERLSTIAGLSYRDGERIVHNPDRPYIDDLDALPWVSKVYRKHLRIADYYNQNALYPMVTLTTSRGCPFRCSFCVYPQTFTGHRVRLRDLDDVVREMAYVREAFPDARSIFFEDDTLTVDRKRCMAFADAIERAGLRMPWTANARFDLDYETMVRLRKAGCRELCVGFESGDQDILNGMRKGIRQETMLEFMQQARRAGLLIHGCFMVGFPGETRESVMRTIELAIRLKPDSAQFYPLMVYPGTAAYEEYRQKGWLTAPTYRDWLTPEGMHNCVVRNEHLRSDELVGLCDLARRRFYLRPGYMAYKALQMLESPGEFIRTAKAATVFFKHLLAGSQAPAPRR